MVMVGRWRNPATEGRKEFIYLTMHFPLNYTTGLGFFYSNPNWKNQNLILIVQNIRTNGIYEFNTLGFCYNPNWNQNYDSKIFKIN